MKRRRTTLKELLWGQMKNPAFPKAHAAEDLSARLAIRDSRIWADEAQARNRALDAGLLTSRSAGAVLRGARRRLRFRAI